MSRVLVLGAAGMLGHKMLQTLTLAGIEAEGTVRAAEGSGSAAVSRATQCGPLRFEVDATEFPTVARELEQFGPDVVVNCIGVIKQKPLAEDPLVSITVNSLFPHELDRWCTESGAQLIHFSTDCVFSGEAGAYREDDLADARDLYGRTKYLGEVSGSDASLTLRTSIIGRELSSFRSLVEWFHAHRGGTVKGFTRVMYSGVTTLQASRVVVELIESQMPIHGLYQMAGPWISKRDLLVEIRDQAGLNIEIIPDDTVESDRTMHGKRFTADTGIVIPSWREMISGMVSDTTQYEGTG